MNLNKLIFCGNKERAIESFKQNKEELCEIASDASELYKYIETFYEGKFKKNECNDKSKSDSRLRDKDNCLIF